MFLQETGSGAWENIKNIFGNIVSGLGNMFKSPINFIINGINSFIRGINKIKIPDWVPGIGGKGLNIREIPRLKVGIDYVPEDYYPAFLDKGERVLTKEQNAEYNRNLGDPINEKVVKTENNQNVKEIGPIKLEIKIDKFINNTQQDVKEISELLAMYLEEKILSKGGSPA